ncbi:MAG: tRNA 4-thiouridine(8) synthase ThiI [Desulfobacterales bacterium]|nr:tRNA 4-thiouridine(8) synthase ThiI [Desulfobacterales bacterium]
MNALQKKASALGLCSGGLDSRLAALVLRNQGIEVEWITFSTPFFSSDKAQQASQLLNIPLRVKNITQTYLKMLKNPHCGFGKQMNPCLDCHALMFREAGAIMKAEKFDFLFSGEVLGQRPMSQTKASLRYVEKNSGFEGYILRPLSAKRLTETIPEQEGLVDRERLLDISGRSRKRQIQLAAEFGVKDYPAPAGGCLLTDKNFSIRLKDLFRHQEKTDEAELELLKYGRHFRVDRTTKIIVGRTQSDNENIEKHFNPDQDAIITLVDFPSPSVLVSNHHRRDVIILAASVCAGYSKVAEFTPVTANVKTPHCQETIQVLAIRPAEVSHLLI